MKKILGVGAICTALTGCVSSGTGPTFRDQAVGLDDGISNFVSTALPVASFDDLPDMGGGEYSGKIGVILDDADETAVIGDLTISVDFGATTNPVSGSAGSFVSNEEERFEGRLDVSNSAFGNSGIATGVGFTSDLDGTLNGPVTGRVDVDADLRATFGTPLAGGGEVVGAVGLVDGNVTTDEGTFAIDVGEFIVTD